MADAPAKLGQEILFLGRSRFHVQALPAAGNPGRAIALAVIDSPPDFR